MFKSIIPGLVSLDTSFKKMVKSYLLRDINFYKETDKKERFHYKLVIDNDFIVPKEYDFRNEYFLKKDGIWFYEKKLFFLTFKFKYDISEKTFYFNKLFTFIPFKIGGLIPMSEYLSSFINMELFLDGFVNFRGFAFQYNNKNYCFVAPGFNGKTTFLIDIIDRGGKYISEDSLLIDFSDMEVYPTSTFSVPLIYNREANNKLIKNLNKNNVLTNKQKIDKLLLAQNKISFKYKTYNKNLTDFLILNSLWFLIDNLFTKSFLFEEGLINKFFEKLDKIKENDSFEFFQIEKFNYIKLVDKNK